jgi:hypothetical protein
VVDAGTAQTAILYLVIGSMLIINRLGGPQEAYYRVLRKPYFIEYFRGPDKRYRRRLFPLTDIETHWPAMHKYGNGMYAVPESEAATSASGAPMWFHAYDDFRAIPQYMDTIIDEETGEAKTVFREKIPPRLIAEGFESTTIAQIHADTEPKPRDIPLWIIITGLAVVIIILIAIGYYDYNTTCAVKSAACGGH